MYTIKKSLGQHFLHDEGICRKIVSVLEEQPVSRLLEVGPGPGALTKYLLKLPGVDFKAVELDAEKVEYLLKTYPAMEGKLLLADFLTIPQPFDESFTLIGNFPYNISTQIVFRVLDWKDQVECMIGMFQKEVAERISSKPGNKVYGLISVLVQAFYEVDYLFEVHENCFTPPPNVKSAVIRFRPLKEKTVMKSERAFFNLVKTAFNQRRKMMRNGVKGLFDAETLKDDIFTRRAEALSVQEFAALTFRMSY
jgi:16S rRNA (adenine1518-N6/adenine1519-N6)-dimethyltransferase